MPTEASAAPKAGVAVLGVALAGGVLSALQSRANGSLSQAFGEPLDAALWSFGSGWILLTLALLLPSARRGLRTAYAAWRAEHLAWWHFLGGILGGAYVAIQTYAVPIVGVALFTISVVAGQTSNALVVDRLGLGPGGRTPVTRGRIFAAAVAVLGVAVAVGGRVTTAGAATVVPVLLGALTGAGFAVQQAVNGRVNRHSGSVMTTTWINFTWGSALLVGLALGRLAVGGLPAPLTWQSPWWTFLGGVMGIVFVAVGAAVVHRLGVLLLMLLTLTGQLTGALVLDLLDPVARTQIGIQLVAGILITFVAAITAGVASRRRS